MFMFFTWLVLSESMTQQDCKCNLCHSVCAKVIFQWLLRGSLYAHRYISQTLQNNVVELIPSKDSSSPGRARGITLEYDKWVYAWRVRDTIPMLIVGNNPFGLICKPPSEFLSSGRGICSKVGCNAPAESLCPPILVGSGLEAVHIIGCFLQQPPCMVVTFTKLISLEMCSRWVISSQSNFWNFSFSVSCE